MDQELHAGTGALITGGSQGLGLAIAKRLIAEGCQRLVITCRGEGEGDAALTELRALGADAHCVALELADLDAVRRLVGKAIERIGPLNALVNCAADTSRGTILDTPPQDYERIQAVNARAPFFLLQDFANHCIAKGHPGSAVNILSIVIYGGTSVLAPYVASKAALGGITKNAAAALSKHRIRVNGINVGWMDTPGEDMRQKVSHGRPDGWLEETEANLPFGMLVKPAHVAQQAAFLLGPASGVVTGSLIDFDQQVIGAYPDTDET